MAYSPQGLKESDMTERLSKLLTITKYETWRYFSLYVGGVNMGSIFFLTLSVAMNFACHSSWVGGIFPFSCLCNMVLQTYI